jgi:hypothetical protein
MLYRTSGDSQQTCPIPPEAPATTVTMSEIRLPESRKTQSLCSIPYQL